MFNITVAVNMKIVYVLKVLIPLHLVLIGSLAQFWAVFG